MPAFVDFRARLWHPALTPPTSLSSLNCARRKAGHAAIPACRRRCATPARVWPFPAASEGLPLDALLRHAPNVALPRGRPDRPRIGRVVFGAVHKWPHLRRRQQLDLVTQTAEHARPVVCATSRLDHDAHRLQLRENAASLARASFLRPISAV